MLSISEEKSLCAGGEGAVLFLLKNEKISLRNPKTKIVLFGAVQCF